MIFIVALKNIPIWFLLIIFILANGVSQFTLGGINCTFLDMAPPISGTLFAISNTISNTAGFLVPLVTGFLTNEESSRETWNYVWLIYIGVGVLGGLVYIIFADCQLQDWTCNEGYGEDDFAPHGFESQSGNSVLTRTTSEQIRPFSSEANTIEQKTKQSTSKNRSQSLDLTQQHSEQESTIVQETTEDLLISAQVPIPKMNKNSRISQSKRIQINSTSKNSSDRNIGQREVPEFTVLPVEDNSESFQTSCYLDVNIDINFKKVRKDD